MPETVEVHDIEVDADDLADALDELPDDTIVDEHALVGDVLVRGDGDRDSYVIVTDLVSGGSSDIIMTESLQTRLDEAVDDGSYPRVRMVDEVGDWGFEIPLADADAFTIEKRDAETNPYAAAWDTSADLSSLISGRGNDDADRLRNESERFDSHAVLGSIEIVEE